MANIADTVLANAAAIAALDAKVSALSTPTVDLSTVAKADALAAVAADVKDIDSKVTPTPVA